MAWPYRYYSVLHAATLFTIESVDNLTVLRTAGVKPTMMTVLYHLFSQLKKKTRALCTTVPKSSQLHTVVHHSTLPLSIKTVCILIFNTNGFYISKHSGIRTHVPIRGFPVSRDGLMRKVFRDNCTPTPAPASPLPPPLCPET